MFTYPKGDALVYGHPLLGKTVFASRAFRDWAASCCFPGEGAHAGCSQRAPGQGIYMKMLRMTTSTMPMAQAMVEVADQVSI